MYERRVDERVAEVERAIQAAPTVREGIERIIPGTGDRPAASDGWLAVFFEFWAAGARVGARLEELGVSRPSVEVETVDALERSPAGKLQVVVAARAPSAG